MARPTPSILDSVPEIDLEELDVPELVPRRKPRGKPTIPELGDPEAKLARRIEKRRMVEVQKAATAARRLAALPRPGEQIHIRMDGTFDGYDFIPALLELLAPAKASELLIATLSFNRRGADRLIQELDDGRIGKVLFVVSAMFQGKERATVDTLAGELAERGSRLAVARNHCKLLLIRSVPERHLVLEGSQNLRRCQCYEQAILCDDRKLFTWHKRFIERVADDPLPDDGENDG